MKNKILSTVLLILAVIVLYLVNLKYKQHNLNKVIEACVVAKKKLQKISILMRQKAIVKMKLKGEWISKNYSITKSNFCFPNLSLPFSVTR